MKQDYRGTLQSLHKQSGLSIGKLAEACTRLDAKVSKAYISKILSGESDPPVRPDINQALGKVLNYPGDVLQLMAETERLQKHYPGTYKCLADATELYFAWSVVPLIASVTGRAVSAPGGPYVYQLLEAPTLPAIAQQLKQVAPADSEAAEKLQAAVLALDTLESQLANATKQAINTSKAGRYIGALVGKDASELLAMDGLRDGLQIVDELARVANANDTPPNPAGIAIMIARLTGANFVTVSKFLAPMLDVLKAAAETLGHDSAEKEESPDVQDPNRR